MKTTTIDQLTPDEFAAECADLDAAEMCRLWRVLTMLRDQHWERTAQDRRTAAAEDALTLARIARDRQAWRSRELTRQHREHRRAAGLPVL
jgi:hypothetical protein